MLLNVYQIQFPQGPSDEFSARLVECKLAYYNLSFMICRTLYHIVLHKMAKNGSLKENNFSQWSRVSLYQVFYVAILELFDVHVLDDV